MTFCKVQVYKISLRDAPAIIYTARSVSLYTEDGIFTPWSAELGTVLVAALSSSSLPKGLLFVTKSTLSPQLSPLAGLCVPGERQSEVCAHWNARGILQLSLPPTPAPAPG